MSFRLKGKCGICQSRIETFKKGDSVECICGEIGIDCRENQALISAREWKNFIRLDDMNQPMGAPQVKSSSEAEEPKRPGKEQLLDMLSMMIKNLEELPPKGLGSAVTHYDLLSSLLLIDALFRSDCKPDS